MNFYSMPIFESKNSTNIVRNVSSTQLTEYVSEAYAKRIIKAQRDGQLWGLYFTKTGRLRASILP